MNKLYIYGLFLLILGCDNSTTPPNGDIHSNNKQITLQLPWFPNGAHSYIYLGLTEGIFANHGFDIEIVGGRGSEIAARALAAGTVDVAIAGGDALVLINAEGGSLKSLGGIYIETPVSIYSLAEKGITTTNDLLGKRVGLMPGSNTFIQYEGIMNMLAIDRSQIDEINVNPQIAPSWIMNGKGVDKTTNENYLDALVHYTHFQPLFERTKDPSIEINEIFLKDLNVSIFGMALIVRDGTFSTSELISLKAAVKDSFLLAVQYPEKAIESLVSLNPTQPLAQIGSVDYLYAQNQLNYLIQMACGEDSPDCNEFLSQSEEQWQETIDTLVSFNLLAKSFDASSIVIN